MTAFVWLQIVLYLVVLLLLVKPLGSFMARVYQGERTFMSPVLGPVERLIYRITGVKVAIKRGKLPGATIPLDYALEYGSDRIEIQADAVRPGQRVVVVDDLLATGGTMAAGIQLLRKVGAVVPAAASLIELTFLEGRKRLDVPFEALVSYDS